MSDLNSPDWATANLALRRRRDEMDQFKRMVETIPMSNLFKTGQSLAQKGAIATPKMQTHQQQNQIDSGWKSVVTAPPPAPRPVAPSTSKKY